MDCKRSITHNERSLYKYVNKKEKKWILDFLFLGLLHGKEWECDVASPPTTLRAESDLCVCT